MFDALITPLGNLLEYFQTARLEKNRNLKDALSAILEAIKETEIYLEMRTNAERDRRIELELSMLWGLAAIKVKEFDPELAGRLQFKETYWNDAISLSRREIYQKGIALKQIKMQYNKLFDKLFNEK